VGSVGDSYDNALAESVIGLFKTEVIRSRGPWRNVEAVEFATLEWGGLVQQQEDLGADRIRLTGRARDGVLSKSAETEEGSTRIKPSPEKPVRFTRI
jgi:hypothetical protein